MTTKMYRTHHEFFTKTNPKGKDYIIALDAGYSGMKVFYENGYFCFPSFVKKINHTPDLFDDKDILFRDNKTGNIYMVGYTAQKMTGSLDTNDTEEELFGRKRYKNEKFRILCQTAIGLALLNKHDNKEIFVQTGLPAAYVKGDTPDMTRVLTQPADFSIKKGTGKWITIQYGIKRENIHVIPQPSGSLYSLLIKNDGEYVSNAKPLLLSNGLVIDIGFGTCDFYGIKNHNLAMQASLDDIGMRAVMKRLSEKILEEYGEDISIQGLQQCLENGYVVCTDEEAMRRERKSISPLLESANEEVFAYAKKRFNVVTDTFREYDYVIVSGGTGEAWFTKIKEFLQGFGDLTVYPSNLNDDIPFLYSNVRGYYMFRYGQNKRK